MGSEPPDPSLGEQPWEYLHSGVTQAAPENGLIARPKCCMMSRAVSKQFIIATAKHCSELPKPETPTRWGRAAGSTRGIRELADREVWESEVETVSIRDHSPTTGVVTVIVIPIAIAALGALILGCCYLRLQRISQSEDEERIVGEGETKEPFLLVQYSAKGPCVERKAKLTPNSTEVHS
ncbi:LOW QUALITY PROTEIN: stannin [Eudromia elegans]